jgi:NagD protein
MGQLSVISDMDGVIYRGRQLLPGAQDFIDRMRERDVRFLFLTNNSEQTPLDLLRKLAGLGVHGLVEGNFITSAMATAQFLAGQRPGGSAFVVGGGGLSAELYKVGYSITESSPDYVVVGKTANFSFPMMTKAAQLIDGGAKFIGTNPDMVDPVEGGTEPAAGVLLAAVAAATGKAPYARQVPSQEWFPARRAVLRRRHQGARR